ncbi:2OG-Fe(II) oxygenase family protein [Candidatus Pelagibacter sp.]|nr:2OG-Fe(II) oxygenase family protein [Candidatus Pelagibacter sp.]
MNNKIIIENPFGPPIARMEMPDNLIESLNTYSDKLISDDIRSKKQDHGSKLVGNVKQEFALDEDYVSKSGLLKFLGEGISTWVKTSMKKQITKCTITESWIVRQFQNEYNPLHLHSGHISGVGYLKVPKNIGETFQKNKKKNFNGHIAFVYGTRQFLSNNVISVTPRVGELYLFPHYLNHLVYPFYSKENEERRSISFNARIDENIFNVYSG